MSQDIILLRTGQAWDMPVPISRASGAENHVCLGINRLSLTVTTLHRYLAEADRLKHHHKLMLVVPAQPMCPELRLHEGACFEHLEPQPEVLYLLHPVGTGGFVNQDGSAIGRAHAGTPQTPLSLGRKVSPGDGQRHQQFTTRLEMLPEPLERRQGFGALRQDLEGPCGNEE